MQLCLPGHRFTLVARLTILTLNLIAAAFVIAATTIQLTTFYDGGNPIVDLLQLVPIGWSIMWITIALILSWRRKTYTPGLDIVMEFFGFGLVIGTTWLIPFNLGENGDYEYNHCDYVPQSSRHSCNPAQGQALYVLEIMVVILVICSGFLHIALFVKACRAVHVERMQAKKDRDAYHELDDRIELVKN